MMKKLLLPFSCALLLTACHTSSGSTPAKTTATAHSQPQSATISTEITLTVGKDRFPVALDDTPAAKTFRKMLPLTISMTEFNGNEKYADLSQPLPTDSFTPDEIQTGDIMLFGSRTLVVFYQSFKTGYAYTRIGKIKNPKGLAEALGRNNISVTFDF